MRVVGVAILENLQSIIDGYHFRLDADQSIEITGVAQFGEQLEGLLSNQTVDILLMEPCVPASDTNHNNFPVWATLQQVLKKQPTLQILVIANDNDENSIRQAVTNGASGYILKEDAQTIRSLAAVIKTVASGGVHFSQRAHNALLKQGEEQMTLTERQLQALSLCAAYPNDTTQQLAARMHIAPSTFRSLLSNAYGQLNARSRMAAVEEARHRGWIT